MPSALWKLSWRESRLLWLAMAILMFCFTWIHTWVVSQIDENSLTSILSALPDLLQRMSPVTVPQLASLMGRLAVAFDHPVTMFACTAWAIARGSDAVSGPLGRGTMELILSQPIHRWAIIVVTCGVTTFGAVGLCLCGWLGLCAGIHTVPMFKEVSPLPFLLASMNLFSLAFFLGGAATLASACDRHRWRTIGIVCALYISSILLKVIGRVSKLPALEASSFLDYFEPQKLIAEPALVWQRTILYSGVLLGMGLLAYLTAIFVFNRRDLPAPL
ncbi:MAG TPA: ABC transporter permease subunit [Pirellulales bacterium]|jgi:ABC-2 type transport system permease protein|nr:ABC transporter permease subunit [Pirellulales bacterium]